MAVAMVRKMSMSKLKARKVGDGDGDGDGEGEGERRSEDENETRRQKFRKPVATQQAHNSSHRQAHKGIEERVGPQLPGS